MTNSYLSALSLAGYDQCEWTLNVLWYFAGERGGAVHSVRHEPEAGDV